MLLNFPFKNRMSGDNISKNGKRDIPNKTMLEHSNFLLEDNLKKISLWNGEDNLLDILENNTYITIQRVPPPKIKLHPVIDLLYEKGFDYVNVLSKYGLTVKEYENIMDTLLPSLGSFKMIDLPKRRGIDLDPNLSWLQRYENRFEDTNWLLQNTIVDSRMTNGQVIANIIKSEGASSLNNSDTIGKSNPLQGTFKQIFIFYFFLHKPWYSIMKYNLSHGERFERYEFYSIFFRNHINLDLMGSDHEEDLDERGFLVFNKFLVLFQNRIQCHRFVTLDGHGRLITRVLGNICNYERTLQNEDLKRLYRNSVNNLILSVSELDIANQYWHMNTLPTNIEDELSASFVSIFNYDVEDNAIIYFNFSGLIGQGEKCLEYISNLKEKGKEFLVMLSYSNVRGAIKATRHITNYLKDIGMRLVTRRSGSYEHLGDFLTFSF